MRQNHRRLYCELRGSVQALENAGQSD